MQRSANRTSERRFATPQITRKEDSVSWTE